MYKEIDELIEAICVDEIFQQYLQSEKKTTRWKNSIAVIKASNVTGRLFEGETISELYDFWWFKRAVKRSKKRIVWAPSDSILLSKLLCLKWFIRKGYRNHFSRYKWWIIFSSVDIMRLLWEL